MKRLVVCCDGTWNRADQADDDGELCPTNVVKLGYRIAKRSGTMPQIIHYDQGVGTGNVLDRYSGGAMGAGLEDNIHDAYRFLVVNYEPGDELYFFGFSRGAFTVRSIIGMIRKCGILSCNHVERYLDAIALYRNDEHPDEPGPKGFRERHTVMGSNDIPVKFLGVWDTVGALGIPLRGLRWVTRKKHQFHDTELSRTVQFAYHALAIDEHRAPFEPALWAYEPKSGQTVEQVWFCGAHSDVGGGYPKKELSDIALDWMIAKARATGLAFDEEVVQTHPTRPNATGTLHNSKKGVYRVTVGIDRPIGFPKDPKKFEFDTSRLDPTQSVHDSVRERWDKDPRYRPGPLREYFKRTNDPRADG